MSRHIAPPPLFFVLINYQIMCMGLRSDLQLISFEIRLWARVCNMYCFLLNTFENLFYMKKNIYCNFHLHWPIMVEIEFESYIQSMHEYSLVHLSDVRLKALWRHLSCFVYAMMSWIQQQINMKWTLSIYYTCSSLPP